jgi:hypothetical protein
MNVHPIRQFLLIVVGPMAKLFIDTVPARTGTEVRAEREMAEEAQRSSGLAQRMSGAVVKQTVSPCKGWDEFRI